VEGVQVAREVTERLYLLAGLEFACVVRRRKEEGGRGKEEGGRRKEEGGRRKEEG
jgi:hypothetical protein